ncbi:hypothetical protein IWW55_005908 [Coemansia sp. RSA 2706]|nr:hypothetical protein IWW55_005908 [Coemansia sp. RSA 2706]
MGTEFEKLMRLAEQNTIDIQRISLEKKQHVGSAADRDARAARDKRRRVELEQRMQQRERDERNAAEERRQQQRLRLERRQRERQTQQQQQQQAAARRRPTKPELPRVERAKAPLVKPEPRAEPKARAALSYDELMRIAAGEKPARPVAAKSVPTQAPRVRRAAQPPAATAARRNSAQPQAAKPARKAPERELDRFGVCKPAARMPERPAARRAPEREADRFGVRASASGPGRRAAGRPERNVPAPSSVRAARAPRQQPAKRRRHEEEEDEYDSMDDFVVDDDEDCEYRAGSIHRMLGVRYPCVDDEESDGDMEVSAAQLMREDRRSARIGRLEDDEEERKLAAEEARRRQRRRP